MTLIQARPLAVPFSPVCATESETVAPRKTATSNPVFTRNRLPDKTE